MPNRKRKRGAQPIKTVEHDGTPAPRDHYLLGHQDTPNLPARQRPTLKTMDKTVKHVVKTIQYNLCLINDERLDEPWYTVRLSAEQYLELYNYVMAKRRLRELIPDKLHYDWSPPGERDSGELVLRQPPNWQKIFSAHLDSLICGAFYKLRNETKAKELVHAGTSADKQLVRDITPCGSADLFVQTPSGPGHKSPEKSYEYATKRTVVIEAATGKKRQYLPQLATTYIQSGIQLVITVDLDYSSPTEAETASNATLTPAYCLYRADSGELRVDAKDVVIDGAPDRHMELKLSDFCPRDLLAVNDPADCPIRISHVKMGSCNARAERWWEGRSNEG